MLWALSVFAMSAGTAVVPVFSAEVYLVSVVLTQHGPPWWVLGPVAAVGQLLGKAVHYLAARGAVRLPRLLNRDGRRKGWRWPHRLGELCRRHPVGGASTVLLSGLVGVPPFAAVVLAAGMLRVPWPVWLPSAATGRVARFCLLAALPGLLRFGTPLAGVPPA
ncbi:membrane protein YqaA, SNARE-associated domain [Actinopolyspora alba]|uniref:Membrane protein YqaA, SNARE-associated domain n=1 Tax=Actinopolyspora alba TaxID=673379 RepID=A0A1I1Z5M0_9ACTN|nr:VTT domain-containing protein [Actinopolyspora alba]SFE26568.1 membrane protein YqaA, SNARE-associated domain [Actinopolyspora alba]